ncbi:glycosyltransferase [Salibacteraceae bacterium]|nr:glycosyltransferase [Flavobacteriales bacterium]MDB9701491.1 glycosyltransferase [Salibacteraceae bacterium]
MKLMVVLSRVPWPLEKGDKLRAYHFIREWSKDHDVALFCLTDSKVDPKAEAKLKEICTEVHIQRLSRLNILIRLAKGMFNPLPYQVSYFYSKGAQKAFDRFLDRNVPDHIFCQLVRTAEYVRKYTIIPKSLDYMDAFSVGMWRMAKGASWPLSMLMKLESKRLENYEGIVQDEFTHRYIISNQDKEQLIHLRDLTVVANGIDPALLEAQSASQKSKKYDVLFTGNMAYRPNVESAKFLVNEIMPIVWSKYPDAILCLAGATPTPQVRSLASEKVIVTGWVDDIAEVYRNAKVFVAPMIVNTGLQNKLLEAMALNVPSVTTSLANNALMAKSNDEVLIGDTPSELAMHISNLLENEALRTDLARRGNSYVIANFSWSKFAQNISQSF